MRDCGARQIYVTHGNSDGLARYLHEELGLAAEPLGQVFEGQRNEEGELQGEGEGTPAPGPPAGET